jgi:hypothetical protein
MRETSLIRPIAVLRHLFSIRKADGTLPCCFKICASFWLSRSLNKRAIPRSHSGSNQPMMLLRALFQAVFVSMYVIPLSAMNATAAESGAGKDVANFSENSLTGIADSVFNRHVCMYVSCSLGGRNDASPAIDGLRSRL